jgi:Sec-independent protein translocase protein TatA
MMSVRIPNPEPSAEYPPENLNNVTKRTGRVIPRTRTRQRNEHNEVNENVKQIEEVKQTEKCLAEDHEGTKEDLAK